MGTVVTVVVGLLVLWMGLLIQYQIIKAAVRNGVIEAKRTMSEPPSHHGEMGKGTARPRDLASLFGF